MVVVLYLLIMVISAGIPLYIRFKNGKPINNNKAKRILYTDYTLSVITGVVLFLSLGIKNSVVSGIALAAMMVLLLIAVFLIYPKITKGNTEENDALRFAGGCSFWFLVFIIALVGGAVLLVNLDLNNNPIVYFIWGSGVIWLGSYIALRYMKK